MEGNVSISKKELLRLLKAQAQLDLLESLGVDNWQGYEWLGEKDEAAIEQQVAAMPAIP